MEEEAGISERRFPVATHDIFSDESILDPFGFDGRMREMGPVVWLEQFSSWFVGQHDAARAVYADPRTFSSKTIPFGSRDSIAPPILLSDDAPAHTKDRAAIMPVLAPASLKAGSAHFAAVADEMVDRLLDEGEGDAYQFTAGFVLRAFPDMLGLPEEGRGSLIDFGQAILNAFGAMNERTQAALARASEGFAWVETQCARDKVSRDGLAERIYALADAGKVSDVEAGLLVRTVLAAGFDTTILAITSAIAHLARDPAQWAKVRDNPALLKNAFEETLRFQPPGRYSNRAVTVDCEVGGVAMKAGDQIAIGLAATGRDPRKWDNPDTFDVERRAVGHLTFGFGVHACIGQVLARMEYEALLSALARRVGTMELTGEPQPMMNNVTTGFSVVPFRVRAA